METITKQLEMEKILTKIETKWSAFKGSMMNKYENLTEKDFELLGGNGEEWKEKGEEWMEKIQEKTGESKEKFQEMIKEWTN